MLDTELLLKHLKISALMYLWKQITNIRLRLALRHTRLIIIEVIDHGKPSYRTRENDKTQ